MQNRCRQNYKHAVRTVFAWCHNKLGELLLALPVLRVLHIGSSNCARAAAAGEGHCQRFERVRNSRIHALFEAAVRDSVLAFLLVASWSTAGTLLFRWLEGWATIDAFHWSVMTATTIG